MIFIVWIVLSVCVGVYWSNKGGSGFWITLAALVFSPLLVGLCCLVSSPYTEALEERQIASGEMARCPACAELIRAEAQLCRYCRTTQAPPVQLR